jgi:integrase
MARMKGTGSIRQLPSGRYQVRFRGTNAPTTYMNRKDAQRWLDVQIGKHIEGTWRAPVEIDLRTKMPLGEYWELWIPTRRGKSGKGLEARTQSLYRGFKTLLEPLLEIPLDEINTGTINAWFASLNPDTPSRNQDVYEHLKTIFNTAVDEEILTRNPCRATFSKPPKKHVTTTLTIDELHRMIPLMPARHRFALVLTFWTGIRFGEMCELRRSDFDMTSNPLVMTISRSVVHDGGQYKVKDPKSEAGKRRITIPSNIVAQLHEHLDTFAGVGSDSLLFPASDGLTHLASSTLKGDVKKGFGFSHARHMIGRDDFTWHDLRHTHSTMLSQNGATLADIMRRLGQSSVDVAMIYQHSSDERDAELASRLALSDTLREQ